MHLSSLVRFCFGVDLLPLPFRGLVFSPADVENSASRTLLAFEDLLETLFPGFLLDFEEESWWVLKGDGEPDDESDEELSISFSEPLSEMIGLLWSHTGEDGTLSLPGL